MSHHNHLLDVSLSKINDKEKLKEVATDLQRCVKDLSNEVALLRNDCQESQKTLKRALESNSEQTANIVNRQSKSPSWDPDLPRKTWVIAEQDYPSRTASVILYDGHTLGIIEACKLESKHPNCVLVSLGF